MRWGLYGRVVRTEGAGRLIAGAAVARLGAMLPLAIVLLVRDSTGSYAYAGAALAASTAGTAIASPLRGRMVDRTGATRVLLSLSLLQGAALAALVLAAVADAPGGVLVAIAGLAGLLLPPTVPTMRTVWSRLVSSPELLQTAYAFEGVLTEATLVAGPLLTGLVAAVWSPRAAVGLGAAFIVAGTAIFATAPPIRRWATAVGERPRLGALASPGVRALLATGVPLGAAVTALEVLAPAFAGHHGSRNAAGLLLAALAAGSLLGGLVYGSRAPAAVPGRRYALLALGLAASLALPALATSTLGFGLLMLAAGLMLAPTIVCAWQVLDVVAPRGAATEAFTWTVSAYMAGGAVGAQVAGLVVQSAGVRTALLVPPVAAAISAALALAARRALEADSEPAAAPRT